MGLMTSLMTSIPVSRNPGSNTAKIDQMTPILGHIQPKTPRRDFWPPKTHKLLEVFENPSGISNIKLRIFIISPYPPRGKTRFLTKNRFFGSKIAAFLGESCFWHDFEQKVMDFDIFDTFWPQTRLFIYPYLFGRFFVQKPPFLSIFDPPKHYLGDGLLTRT